MTLSRNELHLATSIASYAAAAADAGSGHEGDDEHGHGGRETEASTLLTEKLRTAFQCFTL
jgi:hypothetical protein